MFAYLQWRCQGLKKVDDNKRPDHGRAVRSDVRKHGCVCAVCVQANEEESQPCDHCASYRTNDGNGDADHAFEQPSGWTRFEGVKRGKDMPQAKERRRDEGRHERRSTPCEHAKHDAPEQDFFIECGSERDPDERLEQDPSDRILDDAFVLKQLPCLRDRDADRNPDGDYTNDGASDEETSSDAILPQAHRCPGRAGSFSDQDGDCEDSEVEGDMTFFNGNLVYGK